VNERRKSQRGFVAVTLITLLAIAAVLIVYASLLATIPGGEVVVGGVSGTIYYSKNNQTSGPWTTNLTTSGTGESWYALCNFTHTGYTGEVQITWKLQKKGATDWENCTGAGATVTTTVNLDGTGDQPVYASSGGDIGGNPGNHDWKTGLEGDGQYRVKVWVETTS